MLWFIQGADEETGEDREVEIEAPTRREAEAAARRMNLLVSEVIPQATTTPPAPPPPRVVEVEIEPEPEAETYTEPEREVVVESDATDELAAAMAANPPDDAVVAPATSAPRTLSYARRPSVAVPPYMAIRIVATIIIGFAYIAYLLALIGVVVVVSQTSGGGLGGSQLAFLAAALMPSASLLITGLVLHAIAEGLFALRNIARNVAEIAGRRD